MIELDDKAITQARKVGDAKYKNFSDEQIKLIRSKAKNDLFFLAYGLLGYDRLSKVFHGHLCEWLGKTNKEQYREILLPRSHYKSTIVTISDSIQIALPDDLQTSPYPRNLGPNVRLLIAHETSDAASRFLGSIIQHFTANPALLFFFPECIPQKGMRLNKNELELPRSSIWSEPTFDTIGVGGKAQGRHYNYVKPDDIYGAAARDSKAERETTISWVDNLQSLLITPRTDHIDFVGTRWAFDDVYSHIHTMYGGRLKKYIRSCEEFNPETQKKEPIFPEEFDTESLAILKKNRQVWNAQYANNPSEGSAAFQSEWLRLYKWVGPRRISIDEQHKDTNDLDKIILIDPAMNGLAGFIVTGTDSKNRVIVLEAEKRSWTPPELIEKIFQSVIRWQPRLVAIEEVLFSGLFQHWLAREMSVRGISFKLEPVKTGGKAKEVRVHGLSNYFSAGQIYFNENQTELIEEFREFGATDNYHMLDALAYGPRFWRAANVSGNINMYREAERKFLEEADPLTGY